MAELATTATEAPPGLGLSEDAVQRIIRRTAGRKIALFKHTADVGKEDLVQEMALAVSRAKGYDPAKAAASTFVYLVAARTAFDLARKRARMARHDVAMVRPDATDRHPGDEAEDLVDWCERVREEAKAIYGGRIHRIGPRFYRIADVAALVLLAARLKLSPEGLRWLLGQREDLLHACGYLHVPGRRLFEDAATLLRQARVVTVGRD
jgi:DNA-directed RNA polymerase specialized sigma24 family protein